MFQSMLQATLQPKFQIPRTIISNLVLMTLLVSCASGTKTPHEAFIGHWKESGNDVKVIQILSVQGGQYRGNAIVDGSPIEEFYDPNTHNFSRNAPSNGYLEEATQEKKVLFKDTMMELAHELNQGLPPHSRIAVLRFPSDGGHTTRLSENLATKFEMGLVNEGQDVVDREKIDLLLKEQQFQQTESALFDASTSARLGKFVGANIVILGNYQTSLPHKITVTAKAISVETTKVVIVRDKEIPLDGTGSDNRDEIKELLTF